MTTRKSRANPATLALWAIPLAVVLFFSLNLVSSLRFDEARVDLTEDRLYTVSESTRRVLSGIVEPITIRLYASSVLIAESPDLRVYAERVSEVLRTYQQLSGGKITVERVDPLPFSAAEDKAIGFNLQGVNLSRAGEQGYFGLVGTNSVDQLETIPVLAPAQEAQLEYALTRMVLRLSMPREPRIGVIDGLGIFGNLQAGRRPAAIIDRLGDDYVLLPVDLEATNLPTDIDALIVVHPFALAAPLLYSIDQFALGGKPVLAFIDPLAEHSQPDPVNQARPLNPGSSLEPLLASWGVSMAPEQIVGDLGMALSIRAQAGQQVVNTPYVPWLIVDGDNLRRDDQITGRLNLMRMSTSGALVPVAGATTQLTPLIETTPQTMLLDRTAIMRRDDPRELVNSFVSSGEKRTLAARISGPAQTAYPEGAPPLPPDAPVQDPTTPLTIGTINVILVADTDLLADDHNVGQNNNWSTQNVEFVINAIDNITGGGALYELRARTLAFRPFTLVNELEAAARDRYRATELQLQRQLEEAQQKLSELRTTTPDGQVIMPNTAEQQQLVADYNRQIVDLRDQLRDVQAALRQDVESLTNWLRVVNILAVPALIVLVGIVIALWRRMRLARYVRARAASA